MLIQFIIGKNVEGYGESNVLGTDFIKVAPGIQTDLQGYSEVNEAFYHPPPAI